MLRNMMRIYLQIMLIIIDSLIFRIINYLPLIAGNNKMLITGQEPGVLNYDTKIIQS
jgi:hypothetical protein